MENIEQIQKKILDEIPLDKSDILKLLCLIKTEKKNDVFQLADNLRAKIMGDEVFVRSIIEFSNYCRKNCDYCGIRGSNKKIVRYRMTDDEILETCKNIEKNGFTTVVLQSGEDMRFTKELMGRLLKKIKFETELAITVSAGERDMETYKYWFDCGMDRYLLRFETSNKDIFRKIHPDDDFDNRIDCLKNLKKIGVQTGSGFMIGLPDTTEEDTANDILFCRELDLDMIGVGPFIPHPDTPLGANSMQYDFDYYSGIISILRLVNPYSHIPATTAFDALDKNGRQLLLKRGANIFMPNATPAKYRQHYLLYPNKPCVDESADDCSRCVKYRIAAIGRKIGKGPGHSIKKELT